MKRITFVVLCLLAVSVYAFAEETDWLLPADGTYISIPSTVITNSEVPVEEIPQMRVTLSSELELAIFEMDLNRDNFFTINEKEILPAAYMESSVYFQLDKNIIALFYFDILSENYYLAIMSPAVVMHMACNPIR